MMPIGSFIDRSTDPIASRQVFESKRLLPAWTGIEIAIYSNAMAIAAVILILGVVAFMSQNAAISVPFALKLCAAPDIMSLCPVEL